MLLVLTYVSALSSFPHSLRTSHLSSCRAKDCQVPTVVSRIRPDTVDVICLYEVDAKVSALRTILLSRVSPCPYDDKQLIVNERGASNDSPSWMSNPVSFMALIQSASQRLAHELLG